MSADSAHTERAPSVSRPRMLLSAFHETWRRLGPTDRRITENGQRVLFVATLCAFALLIAATIFHIQQLFIMACVIGGLLPVSYLVSLLSLSQLECAVATSARGVMHEQQVATIAVRIRNRGRLLRCFCDLTFRPPEGLTLEEAKAPVSSILGGETLEVSLDVIADRRGVYRLQDLELGTTDLLGLFEFSRPTPGVSVDLVVYPQIVPLSLFRAARSAAAGDVEVITSNRAGSSIEFFGVREFLPGDELRRIHWRTTARTGKLAVVEYEEVIARGMTLILDLERGTEQGPVGNSTLDCAARAAASLANLACSQGVGVELVARGSEDWSVEIQPGDPNPRPVYEALARAVSDGTTPLEAVCLDLARRIERGRPVYVLTGRTSVDAMAGAFPLVVQGVSPTVGCFFSNSRAGRWTADRRSASRALSVGCRLVAIQCDGLLAPQLEELLLE